MPQGFLQLHQPSLRWIFHELHPSAPVHRQTDDSSQLPGLAAGNSSSGVLS